MERTQIGGNRILIILLILIISMSLSACTVGNDHEDIFTTSDITDTHSESDSADTHSESDSADTHSESGSADTHSELGSADTKTAAKLTVEDFPELVPDVLKLREKKYEDMPFLETQEQLSEYALWNFLCGRTEFECRLSWDLSYGVTAVALEQACEDAMSYYLFSSYKPWDMFTKDDGDPDSVYAKVKLVYDAPELDLEARLGAFRYVVNNPPPKAAFQTMTKKESTHEKYTTM